MFLSSMRQWELASSAWRQEQTPHSPLLTVPGFHHFSSLVSICMSSASCEPQRHRSVQDLSVISSEHRESNHVRKLGQLIKTSTEGRASILLPAASLWLSQEVEKWLRAAMILSFFLSLCRGAGTVAGHPVPVSGCCPLIRQAAEVTSPLRTPQVILEAV